MTDMVMRGEARGIPWWVTRDKDGFTGWCEDYSVCEPQPYLEAAQIEAMRGAMARRERMDEEAAVRYSISIALYDSSQLYDGPLQDQAFGSFKTRAEAEKVLQRIGNKLKELIDGEAIELE